jgi:ubiquinone/menaquinone biosynthesis C-methylase UbiE
MRRPDNANDLREAVQRGYTRIAREGRVPGTEAVDLVARRLGYSDDDLAALPEGANLGVGCGNPTAIDALETGETVVDLGCGAGMDSFLAARQVGPTGHVIGVDMTEAMLEKARKNARTLGLDRIVEFRKGNIEALPIENESADAIISNCVINLSPQKDLVYREAYRVLRLGGRIMVSDIVLDLPLPDVILQSLSAYMGCVGGASRRADYLDAISQAGFREVRVDRESSFLDAISFDDPQIAEAIAQMEITKEEARSYADAVTSLHIFALK